jgi:hypothetical protein
VLALPAHGETGERAMTRVDLNSDLGEGYGTYACGDDAAILDLVTSANVACGLHAGDPEIMARTFALEPCPAALRRVSGLQR